MGDLASLIDWSRAQFALTAIYSYLFIPLMLGLGFIIAIMETMYVCSGNSFYKQTVKFWSRLFGINFVLGIITSLILEFEFGLNWNNYSYLVGDVFGGPFVFGCTIGFVIETMSAAIMIFGWNKVGKKSHLLATWLTVLGANFSAFWMLVVNAWMEYPAGIYFNAKTVRCEVLNFSDVISFVATTKFLHTVTAAFVLSAVFVIGISAWYLLKRREEKFAKYSIKVASWFGILATIAVFITGCLSMQIVAHIQPMKVAAMENLYHGRKNLPFSIVPGVEIPGMFSAMTYGSSNSFVPGIQNVIDGYQFSLDGEKIAQLSFDLKKNVGEQCVMDLQECQRYMFEKNIQRMLNVSDFVNTESYGEAVAKYLGYAYLQHAEETIPPVWPVFWSFRLMIFFGLWSVIFILLWLFKSYRKSTKSFSSKWLKLSVATIFMAYIASECGWVVSEVGRQPWIIQDILPNKAAISMLSSQAVMVTFFIFAFLFIVLLCAEVSMMRNQIQKGPDLESGNVKTNR